MLQLVPGTPSGNGRRRSRKDADGDRALIESKFYKVAILARSPILW